MVDIILKKEGFTHVDVCTNYKDTDLLISHNNYDLLILDIMLPDGTGLDLAKKVRLLEFQD